MPDTFGGLQPSERTHSGRDSQAAEDRRRDVRLKGIYRMAEGKKAAISEILEDPKAGRLDFLHARELAYSISGEMAILEKLVGEAQQRYKSSREAEVRVRSALIAGVGLWIQRKYAEAAAALEPAGDDAEGAYFLGLCRLETKEYAGAIKSFRRAAQAGQDAFVCGMAEAEALRRAGNREEALAKIRAFQKSHDGQAELHYQKGRCFEESADYESAMEAYERAVELDPQHVGALFRLGYWNDLRGNDERALDYYEKAAQVRPLHTNVLMNLGVLYEDRGEYERAARTFARVTAGNAEEPRARLYRADAEASLNMFYDEAVERRQHRTAVMLRVPLSEFELSARCRACLEKMNIRTLGDLARMTETEIGNSKNFGETSLKELRDLLESKGLRFGMGRADAAARPAAIASPELSDALTRSIGEMDLSVRSLKCARTLGIETIGDLVQKTDKDLLACPNFGQTSLNEVKQKLASYGLSLKTRD
jgi:DNA-directed RNA polymerase subunit alpha